jgi:hypothetical protein
MMTRIPDEETLLRRILDHDADYWRCISDVEPRNGYVLFHNTALAPRIDPNHAGAFRIPADSGAQTVAGIVADIVAFYHARGVTPAAFLDCFATPATLPDQLVAVGFEEWSGALADVMLYVGPDVAAPGGAPVEVVQSETQRAEWASIMEEDAAEDAQSTELLRRRYTREISDTRMRAYLMRIDGVAVARCNLFSSRGLGRVEAVRTRAAFQGRGLASTIIRQAVLDSMTMGNDLTYIYAEPGNAPQRLYHRLGFRTIGERVTQGFVLMK